MIGVANKAAGYGADDERLLSTFASQVAVAVDNARLYQAQQLMIAELQQLHERLTEAERAQLLAQERNRIAGRLHDRIGQEVFAIGLRLNALLDNDAIAGLCGDDLREVRRLAVASSSELRRAIFTLSTPERQRTDLTGDVGSLLVDLEHRTGIRAHLHVTGEPHPEAETIHELVHSVVREAVNNAAQHAQARTVLVSLRYHEDRVDVVVQDDGTGAPEVVLESYQDSYLHFGWRHLRQQAMARGGTFEVANGEEAGLVLRVSVPLPAQPP
jgi:two-component system sensor histidine kinase UhpB